MPFDQSNEGRLKRLLKKTKIDPKTECWLWIGCLDSANGRYGTIAHNKVMKRTHRVSWELHFGSIPNGLFVLHKCDIPLCVNPDHLFLGTQKDNVHDCMKKGRFHKAHQKGEAHGRHKLTERQVLKIRHLWKTTDLLRGEIAAQFNVSPGMIRRIVERKNWTHI